MESMFLSDAPPKGIEKVASNPVMLSEDEMKWPQEITSEVFRSMPFLSGMDVRVEVLQSDAESGVATGRVEVRNPPLRIGMARSDDKVIILPFVIRGFELSPLDVATDGSDGYFPASQRRIERRLSKPNLGEPGPPPGELLSDTSYFNDLTPPGAGFGGVFGGGATKIAGVLAQALLRAEEEDVQALRKSASETALVQLKEAAPNQFVQLGTWKKVANAYDPKTVLQHVTPSAVLFEKVSSHRARVTVVHRDAFTKEAQEIPMASAQQYMPQEEAGEFEQSGYAVMPAEPPVVIPHLPRLDAKKMIAKTGTYTCFKRDGGQVTGWATPNVQYLSPELEVGGRVLFTNGSEVALQPMMAGIEVGVGALPPVVGNVTGGSGFFLCSFDGDYHAYGPYTIQSISSLPDGNIQINCVDGEFGMPIVVVPTPGIERPAPMGEGMFGIPEPVLWLSYDIPSTQLLMPAEIVKQASAALPETSLVLEQTSPGFFNVSGPSVEKIARADREALSEPHARLLMATCGVSKPDINVLMKQAAASMGNPVSVCGTRMLTPFDSAYKAASEKTASARSKVSVKAMPLLKEAAHVAWYLKNPGRVNGPNFVASTMNSMFKLAAPSLPMQETVDSILSLGVVNARNVGTFVRQKPELEKALSTLCTLLLFARMGAPGIQEITLEQTIKGFEEVMDSLDMLPFNV